MAQNKLKAIQMISVDSATLTGGFDAINPLGLPAACSMVLVDNQSNTEVFISLNGTNAHFSIGPGNTLLIPAQMLNQPNGNVCLVEQGTIIYAIGGAGIGNIYLSGLYS